MKFRIIAAFCLILIIGCTPDLEETALKEKIIGKWKTTRSYKEEGVLERVLIFDASSEWMNNNFLNRGDGGPVVKVSESGTWHVEGTTIFTTTITSDLQFDPEEVTEIQILDIGDANMTISVNEKKETYTRINR